MNDLDRTITEASNLHHKLLGARSALLRRQSVKVAELAAFKKESIEIQKVKIVLDDLIKTYISFQLEKMQEYVTYGLNAVIPDQTLTFKCDVITERGKPSVELLTINKDDVSGNALEGFGGSVAQIQSLILRILAIVQLKLYPLLVLDESLNAVSVEYLPNLSLLLRELADKLGINILLVTHNKEILEHAHRVYQATESMGGLRIEELKRTEVT